MSSDASTKPVGPAPTTRTSASIVIATPWRAGARRQPRSVNARRFRAVAAPESINPRRHGPQAARAATFGYDPRLPHDWRTHVTSLLGRPLSALQEFLRLEAASGIVLMLAAALALGCANSPVAPWYAAALASELPVPGHMSVLHAINDGLMALFFLLVGLEIKREVLAGELRSARRIALPGIAAVGGMLAPAAIYLLINRDGTIAVRGWAIPAATDIAFALGVLALLGARVPPSLKVFLTALAILDDLGAIAIIALFYTAELSGFAVALALGGVAVLIALNAFGERRLAPYLLVGVGVWGCTLASGVHATLAGVAVALTIPLGGGDREAAGEHAPLQRLEHALHPWVAYLIIPVFGFANAGLSFDGLSPAVALDGVTIGIAAGLFVGKQLGIAACAWLAIRAGVATLPAGASGMQFYAVALLCGIGFTMSLFIGALAFPPGQLIAETKLGVLAGSLLSAVCGYALMRLAGRGAG
ncbi:MAG: Na+/H+ antiporter NhaA [Proteobacteria bacterium]|nr:Na+/H+ antiporter NhaA [Pseudomonadota bacterium]